MSKPSCFGTSEVENRDRYKAKCLMCGIEDECIGAYLESFAEEEKVKALRPFWRNNMEDVVSKACEEVASQLEESEAERERLVGEIHKLDEKIKLLRSRLEDWEYLISLEKT